MRKLVIFVGICLIATVTVGDAAIDTKTLVGMWLFDEVDNRDMSPDSSDNGNDAELLKGATQQLQSPLAGRMQGGRWKI